MAKTTSTASKGGKKGGKGKMPLNQRVLIGAALFGLAWYLYSRAQAKKMENKLKAGTGTTGVGYQTGAPTGVGGVGGSGGYTGPIDPNTGLPCSQVFGGCPDGGIFPGGGVTPTTVLGCMDPNANNYNSAATVDNGTCDYTPSSETYGCMDSNANNYNSAATVQQVSAADTSNPCTYDPVDPVDVYGCMDQSANNYDASATIQQVSDTDTSDPCTYDPVDTYGCTDPTANNYYAGATQDDGSCYYCDQAISCWSDCPNPTEQTFTTASCGIVDNCGDSTGWPLDQEPVCPAPIDGCTDATAVNYDPNASNDDGSCYYNPGCTDSGASNYDPAADFDDGSCIAVTGGCLDPNADNYNPNANVSDDSCIYGGCIDSAANNYDPNANMDDGSCTYDVYGCEDPTANNYNPNVTIPDDSCTYDVSGCIDPAANNYNPSANVDDGSCTYDVPGCMITGQHIQNYNPNATVDDGSCQASCDSCNNGYPTSQIYTGLDSIDGCPAQTTPTGSGDPCAGVTIYGCTDAAADNYNAVANTDDGSCSYTNYCYQCNQNNSPVGFAFTTSDNQCPSGWGPTVPTCQIPGCTNSMANNYDPTATTDDGSCIIPPAMTNITCYTDCPNPQTVSLDVPVGTTCDNADYSEALFSEMPPCAPPQNGNGNNQQDNPGENMAFDGSNQEFGRWQRRLSQRILINDTDWNPLVD